MLEVLYIWDPCPFVIYVWVPSLISYPIISVTPGLSPLSLLSFLYCLSFTSNRVKVFPLSPPLPPPLIHISTDDPTLRDPSLNSTLHFKSKSVIASSSLSVLYCTCFCGHAVSLFNTVIKVHFVNNIREESYVWSFWSIMMGKAWLTGATHSMMAGEGREWERKTGKEDIAGNGGFPSGMQVCEIDAQTQGRSSLWKQTPPEGHFANNLGYISMQKSW